MPDNQFSDCVVICGANNWDGVRFHDRQLAERLTEWAPVLYVDPPVSVVTKYRRPELAESLRQPKLRRIGPNLARLTPFVLPGLERRGMAAVNSRLMARAIRKAVRSLNGTIAAVVESSVLIPVMGLCGEKKQVYWAQDDFVGSADLLGLSTARLERGEKILIDQADIIVAANPVVADTIRARGREVSLVPYGCDAALFATVTTVEPATDVSVDKPAAFFMGHLGDRIDVAVLAAVINRGVPVLLVGPQHFKSDLSKIDDLLHRPNVTWVGARDFEDLPRYLAHGHVGLLPYNHSAFNIGSFPLKMLEYLAAGLPVVATDLPAVRWLETGLIDIHDDPEDFATAVERQLATPRDPAADAARREFAAQHTWRHRAEAFAQAMGLPTAPALSA